MEKADHRGHRAEISLRQVLFFICLLIFLTLPNIAQALDKRWAPKLTGIEGYLDMFGSYRNDLSESDLNSFQTKNTYVRERLTLIGFGYIYHPRFIVYQLRVSAGLQHSQNEGNTGPSPWRTASSTAFSLSAIVLPEHPYNLSLWYTRGENSGFTGISSITSSKGARFVYLKQPYSANVAYTSTTRDFGTGTSETDTITLNAAYYRKYANGRILSFLGTYQHSDSASSATGAKFSSDEASLSNSISLKFLDIASSLRISSSRGGENSTTAWAWSENAGLHLPYNFNASFSYNLSKSTSSNASATQGDMSSTKNNVAFSLSHQLYKSLNTRYSAGYTKANTSTGDSASLSNQFNMSYSKRIPWGNLYAGFGMGRNDTDRTGSPATIDEAHQGITVPGSFILTGEDIQSSSLIIYVKNPDVPDQRVLLSENIHYSVAPLGNKLEVRILSLPLGIGVYPAYDFFVSYLISSADVKSSSQNFFYSVRFSLFNNILVPYYNHYSTTQDISNGASSETTTDNLGVQATVSPFTLIAEYTDVKSNINPYKRWMVNALFQKALSTTASLRGSAKYEETTYPSGFFALGSADNRTASASLGIAKTFPRSGLQVSLSGSYGQYWGSGKSDSYTLSTGISYNVKRFSFTFGGSTTSTNSDSGVKTEFGTSTSKRLSQYYFLSVSRRLY